MRNSIFRDNQSSEDESKVRRNKSMFKRPILFWCQVMTLSLFNMIIGFNSVAFNPFFGKIFQGVDYVKGTRVESLKFTFFGCDYYIGIALSNVIIILFKNRSPKCVMILLTIGYIFFSCIITIFGASTTVSSVVALGALSGA